MPSFAMLKTLKDLFDKLAAAATDADPTDYWSWLTLSAAYSRLGRSADADPLEGWIVTAGGV